MASKLDKRVFNNKQIKAAKLLADPTFTGTITELCEEINVARSTFYDWMASGAFRAFVDELIDRYTDAELSRAWKSLLRLVDRGDFQAIKLFFELKGRYKTNQTTADNEKIDALAEAIKGVGE